MRFFMKELVRSCFDFHSFLLLSTLACVKGRRHLAPNVQMRFLLTVAVHYTCSSAFMHHDE